MGALQAHVVGGKQQVPLHEPGGFLLAGLEGPAERSHVGDVEIELGELALLAVTQVPVGDVGRPVEIVNVVLLLEKHLQSLEAVGDFDGDGRKVDPAALLEIRELSDLQAVEQDLPAHAPGADRRRFPVVLVEAEVVVAKGDPERREAPDINVLDVAGRGLHDDLILKMLLHAVGVLAVAAVRRAP